MTDASSPIGRENPAKTVMVVDADILARMAIADFLRDCGYKVIEGASATDVRTVLEAGHDVQVLLIDMQAPTSEDAFALTRAVRADYPEIAIIRTSSTAKLADKAGELCDDGPMIKPYHPQELLRRIQSLRERGSAD